MMSSAVAFQMKGLGSVFQCSAQTVMAWVRSAMLVKRPRRSRLSVNSLNHRSTRFSQELDVGVQVPAAAILVCQPLGHLRCTVRGQVVQHDMHTQSTRYRRVDLLEEPQYVATLGGLAG